MPRTTLSERKRMAVRRDLTAAALGLFLADGYETTTVDRIAETVGMSRRTFFRYFASKEELVVGKWEIIGFDILTALEDRPADEDDWTALRRAFEVVVDHYADPDRREQSLALDQVVASSPALSAAYLVHADAIERRVAQALLTRNGDPTPDSLRAAVVRATAGAASACLHAAMEHSLATRPEDFPAVLDATMTALRPHPAHSAERARP